MESLQQNENLPNNPNTNEVQSLRNACKNRMNGCCWTGSIKDLEMHLAGCGLGVVECEFCDQKYCHQEEEEHFQMCIGIHKSGKCIFHSLGCSFVAETDNQMNQHIDASTVYHFIIQNRALTKVNELTNTHAQMMEHAGIQLLQKNQNEKEMETKMMNLQIALEQGDIKFEMFKQKCMEQFNNLQQEFMNLTNNQQDVRMIETNNVSSKSNELKTIANTVEENGLNIDNLDLRLQIHENTTYGGRILWKIDDFHSRKQQAIVGNVTALHSAPSFSSQYGYKVCLRAYLNGDGMGKGTHMSLFLVIMKSEYDNVLEWPFKKQAKFTLINQQNRSNDVVERMVPNKDSSSFQKPRKEMNIASGCPLFVAIDRLDGEGFVKDDTLFIDMILE